MTRKPTFDQSLESYLQAELDRRQLVRGLGTAGLALGAGYPATMAWLSSQARAAGNDKEHFFIFVELRGGVQWMIATDGRDVDQLPIDDRKVVFPMKLEEKVPAALTKLLGGGGGPIGFPPTDTGGTDVVPEAAPADDTPVEGPAREVLSTQNGRWILLPYKDNGGSDVKAALKDSYKKDTTTYGAPYILGFAAEALKPHVDDVAVVRGVHMLGDFHGRANVEAFSCDPDSKYPHVAAVLAKTLEGKEGREVLALDNLVFENATFAESNITAGKQPVRLTAATLGAIARGAIVGGGVDPLNPGAAIASAVAKRANLTASYKTLLGDYVKAIGNVPDIKTKLGVIKDQLGTDDASLNLLAQLRTASAMMVAGLTRVATICYGAKTDNNNVDGFGLFDAHRGLYHSDGSTGQGAGSFKHHEKVAKTFEDLVTFIKELKSTPYNGKKLWDFTTVVIGCEFARPSNCFGNEGGGTVPGNGHYWFNNNYILLGKGVQGGAWLGGNDPVRQMGHLVKVASLEKDKITDIEYTPIKFEDGGEGFKPEAYSRTGELRPLMARDVVRTVLKIGGVEDTFAAHYPAAELADSKVLKHIVK